VSGAKPLHSRSALDRGVLARILGGHLKTRRRLEFVHFGSTAKYRLTTALARLRERGTRQLRICEKIVCHTLQRLCRLMCGKPAGFPAKHQMKHQVEA
jgi:hypothetical protein